MSNFRYLIKTAALIVFTLGFGSLQAESKPSAKKYYNPNPYSNCHILVSGNTYTIVPKQSVLNLPERYKKRISSTPKGKFLFFKEFKAKNYGWLKTHKVTIEQSKKGQAIAEEKLKLLKESGLVVIAVRKNRPVPVLSNNSTE